MCIDYPRAGIATLDGIAHATVNDLSALCVIENNNVFAAATGVARRRDAAIPKEEHALLGVLGNNPKLTRQQFHVAAQKRKPPKA
jgi:hypothetical protein